MKTKILIAPNAFKHSLSAIEITEVIKKSIDSFGLDLSCEIAPIADGGDGTIDVVKYYSKNSKYAYCSVFNPLMKQIKSKWLLLDKNTAVIELSKASGLALLNKNQLNPLEANTYGSGQLILSALNRGCRKIILTLGGSATVDAGLGAMCALGLKIYDRNKKQLKPCASSLMKIRTVDTTNLDKRLRNCQFTILCDVQNTLTGPNGTSMFAEQKGANKKDKELIEAGLINYANIIQKQYKKKYLTAPMLGAAGGVAYSFKVFLNAKVCSGFSYISKLITLENRIRNSEIIITGEGKLDKQSSMGKGVFELAKLCKKYRKKVIAICGIYERYKHLHNIDHVIPIKPKSMSVRTSIQKTGYLIDIALQKHCKLFINS